MLHYGLYGCFFKYSTNEFANFWTFTMLTVSSSVHSSNLKLMKPPNQSNLAF